MQSIKIHFVFVFVCLYGVNVNGLFNCGETEKEKLIEYVLKTDSDLLPYQYILDQLFDAFDENNSPQMEEMYKLLENITTNGTNKSKSIHSNPVRHVPDRIKAYGYPAEDHKVVTDDGYILHVFRIPYGKKSPQTNTFRPPILIMHGLFEASNSWIALGPDNSLAYLLADAGYDVWLGNARGTEPSREHIRLESNGPLQMEYWSFSWNEIGVYDLPTIIDHILNITQQKQLNYIGFSQGTTSFFVMTSMRPEYNEKILGAHLMAPVASLEMELNNKYSALVRYYNPLRKIFDFFGIYKITIDNMIASKISEIVCRRNTNSTPYECNLMLSILGSNQINCTSLPEIFMSTPAGASIQQGVHYVQMMRNGGFNQFDYDDIEMNRKIYGSDTPPAYDLTKITAPISIYYSKDDSTATMENALKLIQQLKNIKSSYLVPIEDFRHADFTYSRYIRKAVYDKLIFNINIANDK